MVLAIHEQLGFDEAMGISTTECETGKNLAEMDYE